MCSGDATRNSAISAELRWPIEAPLCPGLQPLPRVDSSIVEFTLFGQQFQAISAGPLDRFNHAISFVVLCDDQAELDRYWDGLLANGGKAEQCGWLRDRFGLCW